MDNLLTYRIVKGYYFVMRLKKRFTRKKLDTSKLDIENIPKHVAIIMDGNGRWAQKRGLPRSMGHREGVKNVTRMVRISSNMGLDVLTLYAFSTENWKRPSSEVGILMDLLVEYLTNELEELHKNNASISVIGNYKGLPDRVVVAIENAIQKTKDNSGLIVNIALNYGGRNEIVNATKAIAKSVLDGSISLDEIDEEAVANNLFTSNIPDPDLVVRTSGEYRLSNFLPYQAAYSELYFTPVHWPEFSEQDFIDMLVEYQSRNRRFGGL